MALEMGMERRKIVRSGCSGYVRRGSGTEGLVNSEKSLQEIVKRAQEWYDKNVFEVISSIKDDDKRLEALALWNAQRKKNKV